MPQAIVELTRVWHVPVEIEEGDTDAMLEAKSEATAGDLQSDVRVVLSRDDA